VLISATKVKRLDEEENKDKKWERKDMAIVKKENGYKRQKQVKMRGNAEV
jgi:hypothetical protein